MTEVELVEISEDLGTIRNVNNCNLKLLWISCGSGMLDPEMLVLFGL